MKSTDTWLNTIFPPVDLAKLEPAASKTLKRVGFGIAMLAILVAVVSLAFSVAGLRQLDIDWRAVLAHTLDLLEFGVEAGLVLSITAYCRATVLVPFVAKKALETSDPLLHQKTNELARGLSIAEDRAGWLTITLVFILVAKGITTPTVPGTHEFEWAAVAGIGLIPLMAFVHFLWGVLLTGMLRRNGFDPLDCDDLCYWWRIANTPDAEDDAYRARAYRAFGLTRGVQGGGTKDRADIDA